MNKRVVRESSFVSVLTVVTVTVISLGAFALGRRSGASEGDVEGYERGYNEGAIAQYNLERQNEASKKSSIGFKVDQEVEEHGGENDVHQ